MEPAAACALRGGLSAGELAVGVALTSPIFRLHPSASGSPLMAGTLARKASCSCSRGAPGTAMQAMGPAQARHRGGRSPSSEASFDGPSRAIAGINLQRLKPARASAWLCADVPGEDRIGSISGPAVDPGAILRVR